MHRLVVNPGTPQAWEIVLKPGSNSIGRGQENDFTISHDSVSTLHCQIVVDGEKVRIEDLGSTNGTFINEQPTRDAQILPGQRIRLGEIGMRLESGTTMPITASSRTTAPMHSQPAQMDSTNASIVEEEKAVFCKNHYQNLAKYKCEKCRRYVCKEARRAQSPARVDRQLRGT